MYGNKHYSAIPAIYDGDILVSNSKMKADLVSEARIPLMDSSEVPSPISRSPHTLHCYFQRVNFTPVLE